MNVVNANVCREPTQDSGQVIVRTAMKGSFVKIPKLFIGPGGVFELVLNKEQPHTNRRRQNHDRKVYEQE